MKRVLGIELRRGVGVWAVAPMLTALALLMAAHPRVWAGDWTGWAYYQRTALLAFGPLVVAVSAWQGGREHRRDLDELLSVTPRPPLHRALTSLASPALWAVAALWVTAAAMAVVTASNTTYGRPLIGVAGSAAAGVVLFAAIGYTAGRLCRWRVTAPVAALVTYLGGAVLSYRSDGLPYTLPGVELAQGYLPAPWWPVASTVSFLAAAAALVLLLTGRRRATAVSALILTALTAVTLGRVGADAFQPDRVGMQLICRGGWPQVCLTRRHGDQLPVVAAAAAPVLAGLGTPQRLEEQRFGRAAEQSQQNRPVLNSLYLGPTITGGPDLAIIKDDAAQAALHWSCEQGRPLFDNNQVDDALAALTQWLTNRPAPPAPGSPFQGRSTTAMMTLTRRVAAAANACDAATAQKVLLSR